MDAIKLRLFNVWRDCSELSVPRIRNLTSVFDSEICSNLGHISNEGGFGIHPKMTLVKAKVRVDSMREVIYCTRRLACVTRSTYATLLSLSV
jgi:hypothetical protein